MLKIENLHASVDEKKVLQGITLEINKGEIHAVMGPNGSGKSTLSNILAGKKDYEITKGSINFNGKDLFSLSVDERAKAGLFLAFQYPVEIAGVTSMTFLKESVNAIRKAQGKDELDSVAFLKLVRSKAKDLGLDETLLKRAVNSGFSGGEKKRFETLHMLLLEPALGIMDETDSGLDIDALKTVAENINTLKSPERALMVITHYQRLLNYILPDHVHILAEGRIVESGGKDLALKLEKEGYAAFGINDQDEAA